MNQPHQTLLFSATLDGAVDRLVKRYLSDPVFHEVASATQTVSLMEHRFLQVHQMDKVKVAAAICRNQEKSLLFVRTKRGADRLVENLGKEGVKAAAIHGDLRQSNRERALADFSEREARTCSWPPTWRPGACTSKASTPWCTTILPRTTRRTSTARAARRGPGKAGVVVSLSLWNQLVEMEVIQRRLGLRIPIVEMFSNDPTTGGPRRMDPEPRGERPLSEDAPVAAVPRWSADDGIRRVLVVTAHPDDVDFGAAGTVAAFTSAGLAVTYCIVTNGDAGGFDRAVSRADMAALRQDEQRAAAAAVGVDDVRFLGHPDGMVQPTLELRRDVSRVIRQVRPERVVTQSPERNWSSIFASHPDHLAAGEAAVCAVYPDSQNPFAHPELLEVEGLEPWHVSRSCGSWVAPRGRPAEGDGFAVDTTGTVDAQGGRAHVPRQSDPRP